MLYTSDMHYTALQPFYERLSVGASIHLPLWLPGIQTLSEANHAAIELMANLCAPRQGIYVLDAGCGLGTAAFWIASNYKSKVLGVSNSEANIRRCSETARQRGLTNLVEFRQADLMQHFEGDAVFDVIWCLESLNYLSPKARFIQSAYRMLKPGGVLLCVDRFFDFRRYVQDIPSRLLEPITTGFYTRQHWEGADALLEEARDAGFVNEKYIDLTAAVLDLPRRRRAKLTDITGALLALLAHPASYRSLYKGFRVIRSSYQLMEKGMMTYGLLMGTKPE